MNRYPYSRKFYSYLSKRFGEMAFYHMQLYYDYIYYLDEAKTKKIWNIDIQTAIGHEDFKE